MGDSIGAAVRATSQVPGQSSGWLNLLGDLPLIQSDKLPAVAAALACHEVVVPVTSAASTQDSALIGQI